MQRGKIWLNLIIAKILVELRGRALQDISLTLANDMFGLLDQGVYSIFYTGAGSDTRCGIVHLEGG